MAVRLLPPTAICASAITLLVTIAMFLGAFSLRGETDDSGAIQGLFFCALAGVVSLLGVLLMPLVASKLLRTGRFSRRAWGYQLLASLALFAATTGLVVVAALEAGSGDGGMSMLRFVALWPEWLTLTVMLFVLATIVLIPIAMLWLRLAETNSASVNVSRDPPRD
jgi:hypothetical protein